MKHGLKLRTHESPRKGVPSFTESVDEKQVMDFLNSPTLDVSIEHIRKQLAMWKRQRVNGFAEIAWYQKQIATLLDKRDSDWKDCPNLPAKDWDGNKELIGLRKMLRDLCWLQNTETLVWLVYRKEQLKRQQEK